MNNTISVSVLIVFSLFALITVGFQTVAAQDTNIYIKPDGSVTYGYVNGKPPIKRDGDLYTLTDDVGRIVIQRSNIVLDGDGYRIEVGTHGGLVGISVSRVANVTIINALFALCETGVYSSDSSSINIMNNIFGNNVWGVSFNGSVQNSLIQKNIFSNNDFGVQLAGHCFNTTISENSLSGGRYAVTAKSGCRYASIVKNNITSINDDGIRLIGSSNCEVSWNRITCGGTGVYISDGSNANHLSENVFEKCGLMVGESYESTFTNNIINGKPLVYLEGVSDYSVEDAGQVILVGCRNITVENLNLSNSTLGVELWNTANSRVVNNILRGNNWAGIFLSYSANNVVTKNDVEENGYHSIILEYSTGNSITNNLVRTNREALMWYNSSQNFVYHNSILGNLFPGGSWNSNNSWDNGYRSGGNFWGDNYTGTDIKRGLFQNETGSDGIGDTIHIICENNQDNYPLMNPWHEPPWTPFASFNFSIIQPCINETVTFDAWRSYDFDGEIVNYVWDFGEGIVVNETNPIANHTYTFPRFYNVSLTVVDNEGLSNTTERTINVIKISANLSISSSLPTLILRGNTTLKGSIAPVRAQTNVTIWSKAPSQNEWVILANVTTDEYGNYSYNWTPSAIGSYMIKANWTGDEYTFPSETNSLVVTCTRIPTSLSILTTSSPTLSGFKVEVKGTLAEIYGTILGNETIVLYYTFAGIGTWTPITSDTTGSLGEYNIVWFPPATGYFLLKAEWPGDAEHLGTSNTIAVSTVTYENQYVFAVESNSTISDLSFDTTSRRLRFTANGENGTKGYTKVTIAKNLVADAASLKVHVDGVEYNYTVTETSDSWMLFFTYNHSSHFVEIELNPATPNLLPFLLPPLLVVGVLVAVVLLRRRRGRNKTPVESKGPEGII